MKVTEILQVLSDSTRLRMLRLLGQAELSVAELQEILEMGQSRISSHLSLLRRYEMVADRKEGKKTFYALHLGDSKHFELVRLALETDSDEEFLETDQSALQRIIEGRRRASEQYFDEVAGRLGKNYVPGRSWDAIGHFLLRLVPEIEIADLGAGEDFPIISGTCQKSLLYRPVKKHGSAWSRIIQEKWPIKFSLQTWRFRKSSP